MVELHSVDSNCGDCLVIVFSYLGWSICCFSKNYIDRCCCGCDPGRTWVELLGFDGGRKTILGF